MSIHTEGECLLVLVVLLFLFLKKSASLWRLLLLSPSLPFAGWTSVGALLNRLRSGMSTALRGGVRREAPNTRSRSTRHEAQGTRRDAQGLLATSTTRACATRTRSTYVDCVHAANRAALALTSLEPGHVSPCPDAAHDDLWLPSHASAG